MLSAGMGYKQKNSEDTPCDSSVAVNCLVDKRLSYALLDGNGAIWPQNENNDTDFRPLTFDTVSLTPRFL